MRKSAVFVLLALAALAAPALARPVLGVGVFLGSPTGLSVGVDLGDAAWIDGKLAWDFARDDARLIVQGSYVLSFPGTFVVEGEDIVPFVGLGALASIEDTPSVALMLPFGVDYTFRRTPIELFLELDLGMALIPSTSFVGGGGLGVRYRFAGR